MKTIPTPKMANTNQEKNKTNIKGINVVVKRPGKSKVRAVPDFMRLHKKWENQLQQGKACTKKPCTRVEEFHLHTPGSTDPCSTRILNENQENIPASAKADGTTIQNYARIKKTIAKSNSEAESQCSPKIVTFQADTNALKSILENTGISAVPQSRQTMNAVFRTPVGFPATSRVGRMTDIRRSIYYTGVQPSKAQYFTEFTQRTVSRMTADDDIMIVPQRNSIYCKMVYPKSSTTSTSISNDNNDVASPAIRVKKPHIFNKATRVPKATPSTSRTTTTTIGSSKANRVPGSGLAKAAAKNWASVLAADSVVTQLDFNADDDSKDDHKKLAALEEEEKRLEAEIVSATPKHHEVLPETSKAQDCPQEKPARIVFGVLSKDEIARRSTPGYNPYADKKCDKPATCTTPKRHMLTQALSRSPRSSRHLLTQDLSRSPCSSRRLLTQDMPRSPCPSRGQVHESPERRNQPVRLQSPLARGEKKLRCNEADATLDIITVSATDKSVLEPSPSPLQYLSPNVPLSQEHRHYQVMQVSSVISPASEQCDKENIVPIVSSKVSKSLLDKFTTDHVFANEDSKKSGSYKKSVLSTTPTRVTASPKFRAKRNSPYSSPKSRFENRALPRVGLFSQPPASSRTLSTEVKPNKMENKKVHWKDTDIDGVKANLGKMQIDELIDSIDQTKTQIETVGKMMPTEMRTDIVDKQILIRLEEVKRKQEQIEQYQEQLFSKQNKLQQPCTPTQSYADFIAANVEDISPYMPADKVNKPQLSNSPTKTDLQYRSTNQVVPMEATPIGCKNSPKCCNLFTSPAVGSPLMAGLSQLVQRTPDTCSVAAVNDVLDISCTPPDVLPCGQVGTSSMCTTTVTFSSPAPPTGSLSLAAHLTSWPPIIPSVGLHKATTVSQTVARFHDALLDDEVALYACRIAKRHGVNEYRSSDPVASLLTDSNDMQFVPIKQCVPQLNLPGSAFSTPQHMTLIQ